MKLTLVTGAGAPADGVCDGKACWRETRRGFKFRRRDLSPSGTKNRFQMMLKEGTVDGRAQIIVKGKAGDPPIPALPIGQPLTVQLQNSERDCWQSTLSAPATINQAGQFKDRND